MITLHETGQAGDVNLRDTLVVLQKATPPDLLDLNPLGKIPVLITDEGTALADSRVICEYLDLRAGAGLIPADPQPRMQQLGWQVLADGLIDILLIWRTELVRPAGPWPEVTQGWLSKTRAIMARLDSDAPVMAQTPFGIGHIAVLCALGHLDFRWPDTGWRQRFPDLATLEAELSQRPSATLAPAPVEPDPEVNAVTQGHLSFPR